MEGGVAYQVLGVDVGTIPDEKIGVLFVTVLGSLIKKKKKLKKKKKKKKNRSKPWKTRNASFL